MPRQHTDIDELEAAVDRLLRLEIPELAFERSLKSALAQWSSAVVSTADEGGASAPSASELERGLRFAHLPVFVCGTSRSGTTLLRDLLDGHPELAVIPVETGFYGMARPLMQVRGDSLRAFLTAAWLERLARAPPGWLLPATKAGSPYVALARRFAGWWQVADHHSSARNPSWPLAAFALAYAQQLGAGRLPDNSRMWVEKTPGHCRHLDRIWQDFPAARVIQIVRHPQAVLASFKAAAKRLPPHRVGRRRTAVHILTDMAPAYRLAADSQRQSAQERYHLVRYEDLTADPPAAMERISKFLGIDPASSLLQPTVAGRPARGNTSFDSRPRDSAVLDAFDRALLAIAVQPYAARLGYGGGATPSEHRIVGG